MRWHPLRGWDEEHPPGQILFHERDSLYKLPLASLFCSGIDHIISVAGHGSFSYSVQAQSLSHVWLFCDPMDCSPPGYPWDSPDGNIGVGCHFFLQGVFLTQISNLHLLHWQMDSLPLNPLGSPSLQHRINQVNVFCPFSLSVIELDSCFQWSALPVAGIKVWGMPTQ